MSSFSGGPNSPCDYSFKVLVVGDTGVGKTSLLNRYCTDTFPGNKTSPTIGIQQRNKYMEYDDKRVSLTLFDTSGNEKYESQISDYYAPSDGVIVVYDITDSKSFDGIKKYVDQIRRNCSKWVTTLIVGTKSDLREQRRVPFDYAEMFAFQLRIELMETSAKDKYNSHVDDVFGLLIKELRGIADMHAHDREEVWEDDLEALSPARTKMPIKAIKERRLNAVDAGFGGLEEDNDSMKDVPPPKAIEGFGPTENRDKAREVIEEARHHEDPKACCCII